MATLADLEENSFAEVLSFLGYDLGELEPLRLVAKCFLQPCDARKAYIHRLFQEGAKVQIVNLSSAKGREMNGRVAAIDGPLENGRYPLRLRHISGDVEAVALKARNLNPFFALSEEEERRKAKRQAFVGYAHLAAGIGGDPACVLEGHGRMMKLCFTALKWYLMHIKPMPFFVNVDMQEFVQFEGRPQTEHLAVGIYGMLHVIPDEMEQTGSIQAGITDFPTHLSLYSMLLWQLQNPTNEREYVEYEGAMVARCGLDGDGGGKIVDNFCRFVNVWDSESIGIAGYLWVVRMAEYGTLVVEHVDPNVFSEKEEALGRVFIIKGMGSRVGETLTRMPRMCKLRVVPIYNVLVYDGYFSEAREVTPSAEFVGVLKAKVDSALRKQEVIFCGKSSYEGLWDDEPQKPAMPDFDGPTHASHH